MPLEEWVPFQDRYAELFLAIGGDKRMALFMRSEPGADISTLLIPAFQSELVEAFAPGGWIDFEDPTQQHWVLLVGEANAPKTFGITLGLS